MRRLKWILRCVMDKPVSISVKAWIIRNMSVKMMVQERVIETVVNHQFESAYLAMDRVKSVEFSGFGKLYFNVKRGSKKLKKFSEQIDRYNKLLENPDASEDVRRNLQMRIQSVTKNYEFLKKKMDEI